MSAILDTQADVMPVLRRIADSYPPAIAAVQRYIDVPRTAFNLSLLFTLPRGARVGDIGGGLGLFSPGCSALGFDVTLVDDFGGAWQKTVAEDVFDRVHRAFGVKIVRRDVVADGVEFAPESFDAFTIFDTIEHWHNSPKRVFHQLMAALKPGGLFIISSPNCVNLRKRITVPFGVGKWTLMQDWYEVETVSLTCARTGCRRPSLHRGRSGIEQCQSHRPQLEWLPQPVSRRAAGHSAH